MTETPERIWRVKPWTPSQSKHGLASWTTPEEAGPGATEYVRADTRPAPAAVTQALDELADVVACRCGPEYKDRRMHHPECHYDSQAALDTLRAALAPAPVGGLTRERVSAALSAAEDACDYDPHHDLEGRQHYAWHAALEAVRAALAAYEERKDD
jgi:hypothetical protein